MVEEKCTQRFGRKPQRQGDNVEDIGVDGRYYSNECSRDILIWCVMGSTSKSKKKWLDVVNTVMNMLFP